jgi:hypothetical protein
MLNIDIYRNKVAGFYTWNKKAESTKASEWINSLQVPDNVELFVINSERGTVEIYNSTELNAHPCEDWSFNYILHNLQHDLHNANLISNCNHTFKKIDTPEIWYNFFEC